jgi:pyruvate kinase
MSLNKKKIFCTLGPSSLNKKFLNFSKKNVDLLRINMSHVEANELPRIVRYIRNNTNVPICIDTEGAQIRTKVKKKLFCKLNTRLKIFKDKGNFKLYPLEVYDQLKPGDILDVGFSGLEIKVTKKDKKIIITKVQKSGLLEANKGVHLKNRKIKINYITSKDILAINIAKKLKIKNFALSFTNSVDDVKKFNSLLKTENKIFKLETKTALKDIKNILKSGNFFLIDRGDLSKDISIEQVPVAQRQITALGKKFNSKIYVATNFLETMITNNTPTRGEANDIYNTLELGANGLVLAAETAIGKYPIECVKTLQKIIKIYNKYKNKY